MVLKYIGSPRIQGVIAILSSGDRAYQADYNRKLNCEYN